MMPLWSVLVVFVLISLLSTSIFMSGRASLVPRVDRDANWADPNRKKNMSDYRVKEFGPTHTIAYHTAFYVRCRACDILISNAKSAVEKHIFKDRKTKKEFRAGHAKKVDDLKKRDKLKQKGKRQMVCVFFFEEMTFVLRISEFVRNQTSF